MSDEQLELRIKEAVFVPSTATFPGNEEDGEGNSEDIVSFMVFTEKPKAIASVRMRRGLIEQKCSYDFFNPSRHEGRRITCSGTVSFMIIHKLTIPVNNSKLSAFVEEDVVFGEEVVRLTPYMEQFLNVVEGPIRSTRSSARRGFHTLDVEQSTSDFRPSEQQDVSDQEVEEDDEADADNNVDADEEEADDIDIDFDEIPVDDNPVDDEPNVSLRPTSMSPLQAPISPSANSVSPRATPISPHPSTLSPRPPTVSPRPPTVSPRVSESPSRRSSRIAANSSTKPLPTVSGRSTSIVKDLVAFYERPTTVPAYKGPTTPPRVSSPEVFNHPSTSFRLSSPPPLDLNVQVEPTAPKKDKGKKPESPVHRPAFSPPNNPLVSSPLASPLGGSSSASSSISSRTRQIKKPRPLLRRKRSNKDEPIKHEDDEELGEEERGRARNRSVGKKMKRSESTQLDPRKKNKDSPDRSFDSHGRSGSPSSSSPIRRSTRVKEAKVYVVDSSSEDEND